MAPNKYLSSVFLKDEFKEEIGEDVTQEPTLEDIEMSDFMKHRHIRLTTYDDLMLFFAN